MGKNWSLSSVLIVIALFFWLMVSPDSFKSVFAAGGEALGRCMVGLLKLIASALPSGDTPIPTPSGPVR